MPVIPDHALTVAPRLIEAAAYAAGCSPEDVISPLRTVPVAAARMAVAFVMRRNLRLRRHEIAPALGISESSVGYAVREVSARITVDPLFRRVVDATDAAAKALQ